MGKKLIIEFQIKYNDPVSKQSALSPLSANKPPNFTSPPPPICSTLWRAAKASPTCPNRTRLQIRFCPHPVLRKDQVKQLILHVNKDRCKGKKEPSKIPPQLGQGGPTQQGMEWVGNWPAQPSPAPFRQAQVQCYLVPSQGHPFQNLHPPTVHQGEALYNHMQQGCVGHLPTRGPIARRPTPLHPWGLHPARPTQEGGSGRLGGARASSWKFRPEQGWWKPSK